jgi:spore maturation protein CgeB
MNDFWSLNIEILRKVNPEMASRLEREPTNSDLQIIPCQNGDKTARLGSVTLHSRYNPRQEAHVQVEEFLNRHRTQLDNAKTNNQLCIIVFGFGMGYHIEELLDRLQKGGDLFDNNKIIVIEPRYALLRVALEFRDLTKVLPRISLLDGPYPDLSLIPELKDVPSPLIYIHAPSKRLDPEILERIETQLQRKLSPLPTNHRLKILAVSPIYGGSLPILHYSTDALKDMGHKVEIFNNTPYYDILMGIDTITKDKTHQNSLRVLLTTFLAECAVAKAVDMKADIVFGVAQSPFTPESLKELKEFKIPSVFWFVEDRYLFPYWKEYAPLYDHFFVIQSGEFVDELKAFGVRNCHYLPTAAHPSIHRQIDLTPAEKEFYGSDLSFMGAGYYNRHQTFLKLLDFDFKIWGTEWNLASPLGRIVQKQGQRLTPEEYIKIFNASKININLHSSPVHESVNPHGDFVNPRTFELAACQAFQLVDYRSQLPELFEIGKEIIVFDNVNELRDKARYYLDHPDERKTIAQLAQKRVLSQHTYRHRMETMMNLVMGKESTLRMPKTNVNSPSALIQQAGPDSELGKFLAKFENEDELTLDRIAQEIRKGKGELTHTEGVFLLMKEFQDWAREKGVIN